MYFYCTNKFDSICLNNYWFRWYYHFYIFRMLLLSLRLMLDIIAMIYYLLYKCMSLSSMMDVDAIQDHIVIIITALHETTVNGRPLNLSGEKNYVHLLLSNCSLQRNVWNKCNCPASQQFSKLQLFKKIVTGFFILYYQIISIILAIYCRHIT